jgi:uncharacterized OB-fold protein
MPDRHVHPEDDDFERDEEDEHDERDRRRFSSETAFCPECGAEIYDAADVCPKCFTWIDGETIRHGRHRLRGRLHAMVVWLLIVAMLAGAGVFALGLWF